MTTKSLSYIYEYTSQISWNVKSYHGYIKHRKSSKLFAVIRYHRNQKV